MTATLLALLLSAAPATESRLFIATGSRTESDARRELGLLKLPAGLQLRQGYPRVMQSDTLPGLNPGFWLVVLGACPDTERWPSHNDGLAALIQRELKGAYAKPVAKQDAAGCPLWMEGPPEKVRALLKSPDDVKKLHATAKAMHAAQDLLGADILLRRALALGATDKAVLDLYRTVEFILEDLPYKLP